MNTDIRSMDSPIVVMLRNEFFILIDINYFAFMIYNDVDHGICLQFVLILRKRRRRESFRVGLKELPNSYWIKLNTNTTISDSDPEIQIQTYQIQIY